MPLGVFENTRLLSKIEFRSSWSEAVSADVMAFGFPYPKYSQRRTFDGSPDELFAVVRSALEDLGWRYKVLWGKDFEAEVPTAHWSWHHVFKVRFFAGGVIEAESHSAAAL
jgi:hypothetical protein